MIIYAMDVELSSADKKCPRFSISGRYTAKCVDVYDGDTAQFVFRLWPERHLERFTCRFLGYNTAEVKGGGSAAGYYKPDEDEVEAGKHARDVLRGHILNRTVTIEIAGMDRYARPLVTVFVDGRNINQWMIDNGYGIEYDGSGEKKW